MRWRWRNGPFSSRIGLVDVGRLRPPEPPGPDRAPRGERHVPGAHEHGVPRGRGTGDGLHRMRRRRHQRPATPLHASRGIWGQ